MTTKLQKHAKAPDISANTMQGMIRNANRVLDLALDPDQKGIPRSLFEKCVGIIVMSVMEAGFIFAGTVSTAGIILAKQQNGGGQGWSLPCACDLTGAAWGALVGGSAKDVIVFIMDNHTLESVESEIGLKLGGQAEVTLGPFGRSFDVDFNVSGKGLGSTVSVAFSKGIFLGLSVEGSIVRALHDCNKKFYGNDFTAVEILKGKEGIEIPEGRTDLLNELYDKVNKLAGTETAEGKEREKQENQEKAKKAAIQLAQEKRFLDNLLH